MSTIENREIRGWILRICERAQPYGASFAVIETALMEAGFHCTISEVKSHLMYLEEKGYIHTEEIVKGRVRRRINSISPKGIDLLEGSIGPDPGVLLDA